MRSKACAGKEVNEMELFGSFLFFGILFVTVLIYDETHPHP